MDYYAFLMPIAVFYYCLSVICDNCFLVLRALVLKGRHNKGGVRKPPINKVDTIQRVL